MIKRPALLGSGTDPAMLWLMHFDLPALIDYCRALEEGIRLYRQETATYFDDDAADGAWVTASGEATAAINAWEDSHGRAVPS